MRHSHVFMNMCCPLFNEHYTMLVSQLSQYPFLFLRSPQYAAFLKINLWRLTVVLPQLPVTCATPRILLKRLRYVGPLAPKQCDHSPY